MRSLILIFIFTITSIFSQENIESQIKLSFTVDTRFGLAKGNFKKAKFNMIDKKKGKAFVEIDVASIDTDNSMRDNHLRDPDFFDVEKFPKAEFEILSLELISDSSVKGKGSLTIKGIKKDYEFSASLEKSETTEIYKGKLILNRKDFGINYDSIMNPIKNNVNLEFTATIQIKK
jgi:polyisoprenoid-binding protein YceI